MKELNNQTELIVELEANVSHLKCENQTLQQENTTLNNQIQHSKSQLKEN